MSNFFVESDSFWSISPWLLKRKAQRTFSAEQEKQAKKTEKNNLWKERKQFYVLNLFSRFVHYWIPIDDTKQEQVNMLFRLFSRLYKNPSRITFTRGRQKRMKMCNSTWRKRERVHQDCFLKFSQFVHMQNFEIRIKIQATLLDSSLVQ